MSPTGSRGPTRRELLAGAGAVAVGGLVTGAAVTGAQSDDGAGAAQTASSGSGGSGPVGSPTGVAATGRTQAGVARPEAPTPHLLLAVFDLGGDRRSPGWPDDLRDRLARMGDAVLEVTGPGSELMPDGAGDLTVTVGLGSDVVAALDRELPGAARLPDFVGDDGIAPSARGGDLLVAVAGSEVTLLGPVLRRLEAAAGEVASGGRASGDLVVRWTDRGTRGPGEGTVTRSPIGHHDGIVVPRGDEELAQHVWIDDGPMAGGTICVVRRLRVDLRAFGAESPERRDEIVGRRHADGAPLSGGERMDPVDLRAKTPDGRYLVPARSHVRAAHPSMTGAGLMLRRSYGWWHPASEAGGSEDGVSSEEAGTLFVSFQKDLETFVRTQSRLDEVDDLMGFVTPTASGSFLVLPGFDVDRPLGATLPG